MDLAKITVQGQITIPKDVRKRLRVKGGDKVVFVERGRSLVIANASMLALREVQEAFRGEAERMGLRDEDDVARMMKELRHERWHAHADNA
jgi:AbrB family looped-hinge helix DNA binding protein